MQENMQLGDETAANVRCRIFNSETRSGRNAKMQVTALVCPFTCLFEDSAWPDEVCQVQSYIWQCLPYKGQSFSVHNVHILAHAIEDSSKLK